MRVRHAYPDMPLNVGNCHLFPELVNRSNQIIADAANHDHGGNGPHDEYWHLHVLLLRPGSKR